MEECCGARPFWRQRSREPRRRIRPVFAGLALLALMVGGCRRTPAPKSLASTYVKPFNFDAALGEHRYHINGYIVRSPESGRLPAVLILNAGQGDAARCVSTHGNLAATLGVQVACISIPGYGHSSGPSRLVGPQAVAAARRALDLLAARSDVDPKRLAVWGIGEGAVAAGLLMDEDPRARNLVLQSGAYDMLRLWPQAPLGTKLKMLHEVWPSRRVLRERSVIENLPTRVNCNVLVIHGERDRRAPMAQALRLVKALQARGAEVSTSYFPGAGHDLGRSALKPANDFLRRTLLDPSGNAPS